MKIANGVEKLSTKGNKMNALRNVPFPCFRNKTEIPYLGLIVLLGILSCATGDTFTTTLSLKDPSGYPFLENIMDMFKFADFKGLHLEQERIKRNQNHLSFFFSLIVIEFCAAVNQDIRSPNEESEIYKMSFPGVLEGYMENHERGYTEYVKYLKDLKDF
jgi:hypothetical protein